MVKNFVPGRPKHINGDISDLESQSLMTFPSLANYFVVGSIIRERS